MNTSILRPRYHADDDRVVVRPALGLTLWTDDPGHWRSAGLHAALRAFFQVVSPDEIRWSTTSLLTHWIELAGNDLHTMLRTLDESAYASQGPRHHFFMRLGDTPQVPSYGFSYTEVDTRRAARAGVIEVTLPLDAAPAALHALALALTAAGPFHALLGGHVARWNPVDRNLAFDQIYLWATRYLGLDVQDADAMAWEVTKAVPGVSWLTAIGHPLARAREIDLATLYELPWSPAVERTATPHGLLLRAGEAPTLGDLNAFETPYAYLEVARALAPWWVESPPLMWGAFLANDAKTRWFRRFIDPFEWPTSEGRVFRDPPSADRAP
jgi:hypothetical protein